jgi:hypothetical protein
VGFLPGGSQVISSHLTILHPVRSVAWSHQSHQSHQVEQPAARILRLWVMNGRRDQLWLCLKFLPNQSGDKWVCESP